LGDLFLFPLESKVAYCGQAEQIIYMLDNMVMFVGWIGECCLGCAYLGLPHKRVFRGDLHKVLRGGT